MKIIDKETHRENCLILLPKLKTISLNVGPINQEKEVIIGLEFPNEVLLTHVIKLEMDDD